jgi:alkylation response protein AidB-like acyl-CoA dehydrogenase
VTEVTDVRSAGGERDGEVLAQARELRPLFSAHGEAGEAKGELTDEVVKALDDGGLWGIWTPASLGGAELSPVGALEVIEEVSYADPSTGWVLMAVALATGTGGAYLGDDAVDQLFAGGRIPAIGGQGTPRGKAFPESGGYVLSGDWSYGSGILHCDYIHTGGIVYESEGTPRLLEGGIPDVRVFVLPRDQVAYGANWDVMGLRATGSIDYTIEPTFVPEDWTHPSLMEEPRRGGVGFRLGIAGFGCICHSAFALGVGRRVLDELAALVQGGVARPGQLADSEMFHAEFARAEARFRAARAFVHETWRDIQGTLAQRARPSTRQQTLARLALNNATWTVSDGCMFAYTAGGGLALRQSTIQRLFRDMHAGTQHFTSGEPVLRECGRELVGVAADKVWRFFELADPV